MTLRELGTSKFRIFAGFVAAVVLGNAPAMAEEGEDEVPLSGYLININQGDNSVHEYDLVSGARRTIYQLESKYSNLEYPIVKVGEESFILRAWSKVPASEREGGGEANAPPIYRLHALLFEDGEAYPLGKGGTVAFFPKHRKLLYRRYHKEERLLYLYEAELAGRRLGPGRNVGIVVHNHFRGALTLSDDEVLVRLEDGTHHSHARYNVRTGQVTRMSLDSCEELFWRSRTQEVVCRDAESEWGDRKYFAVDFSGRRRAMEFGRLFHPATYVPQGDCVIGRKLRFWSLSRMNDLYAFDLKTGRSWLIAPGAGTAPGWSFWTPNRG